jgi:hypothetical protein
MKKKVLLVLTCIAMQGVCFAGERSINVQGKVTNPAGTPITGEKALTFKLYDSTATNAVQIPSACETKTVALGTNGVFNVQYGTSSGTNLDALPFDRQYWLGMNIGGQDGEIMPRQPLTASPYAFGSTGNFHIGKDLYAVGNSSITGNATIGGGLKAASFYVYGAATSLILVESDGPTNPAMEFKKGSVRWKMIHTGDLSLEYNGGQKMCVQNTAGGGTMVKVQSNPSSDAVLQLLRGGDSWQMRHLGNLSLDFNGSSKLTMTPAGNIGIGTDSPLAKLSVYGTNHTGIVRIGSDASSIPYLIFARDGYPLWQIYHNGGLGYDYNGQTKMILNENGKLGLGTTLPTAMLHVYGTNHTAIVKIESDANSYPYLQFKKGPYTWTIYENNSGNLCYDYSGVEKIRFENDGDIYYDGRLVNFSPDIRKHALYKDKPQLQGTDYLFWAFEDASKPHKTGEGLPHLKKDASDPSPNTFGTQAEIDAEVEKYGKDISKIAIGTCIWAKSAQDKIDALELRIAQLEQAIKNMGQKGK